MTIEKVNHVVAVSVKTSTLGMALKGLEMDSDRHLHIQAHSWVILISNMAASKGSMVDEWIDTSATGIQQTDRLKQEGASDTHCSAEEPTLRIDPDE